MRLVSLDNKHCLPRPVSAKWVGLLRERWLVAHVNDCQVPAMPAEFRLTLASYKPFQN